MTTPGYSPIRGGAAYLPVTAGIAVAAGISGRLFVRTGTRLVIVAGALIAAAGIWYLSRIAVHGSYRTSLLPGLVIMATGLSAVLVAVTTAANAGVPQGQAGLAAGLPGPDSRAGTGRLELHPAIPRGPATNRKPPAVGYARPAAPGPGP